jgi:hypothetical protein
MWFKRANLSSRDNWRWDLWRSGSGNCFCADPEVLMESGKIITAGITFSFFEFCNHFYNNESNILDSFLLNNPVIKKSNGFPYDFSTKFWTSGTINVFKLSRLRIRDFLENGKLDRYNSLASKKQI